MRKLMKNQKGQGTTEYIVILAIVIGLALTVFYTPLKQALSAKVGTISQNITTAGN
jgi:hypothetical protein